MPWQTRCTQADTQPTKGLPTLIRGLAQTPLTRPALAKADTEKAAMALDLPVEGETNWDDKLTAALTLLDQRLASLENAVGDDTAAQAYALAAEAKNVADAASASSGSNSSSITSLSNGLAGKVGWVTAATRIWYPSTTLPPNSEGSEGDIFFKIGPV